ncbi:sensor histidine kinase [Streptomyces mobaraensis NBRC 13819 = DSM 40847]|uniref:histidine kinase n=1 Tax=Streptomyces mobaraensis (strain ATCC 29032 / DSM 40847 / JCM 4168 / NBRC 13819 / NCIMB 11159 / IPCR 16-22) TaxID=1223523 RepID=M3B1G4_STRM1|nr:sensor histidine kinase [Streptomyces mobaraensis]EME99787.1 two-component system sensor kinase [Streptomyces mobaraensis NBRC 13819 = DSM 40847]QTT73727.1 sensor histidine kinase [Streptomyces mobaraensis NBRC 13819 = DSM 40847]
MHLTPLTRPLLRPLQGVGRPAAFHLHGALIQCCSLLLFAVPWLNGGPTRALSVLLAVFGMAAVVAVLSPVLTGMQRTRFRDRLGVDIPGIARPGRGAAPLWEQLLAGPRAERFWPQARYHLVFGPLTAAAALGALVLAVVSVAAVTIYVWIWALPVEVRLSQAGYSTLAAYVTAGGAGGLYAAVWAVKALARLDTRVALSRLGPTPAERLARRVEEVTESRAGVVDAADAERRRIERDLHDGAQQRLVSMAVNLGLAKVTLTDLPEDARKVIDEAHREAKAAIQELSDLVRGLHPAVLEDRGLDAALSGIADRAPLPVRVRVDLESRPAPAIEAVAYFVVSEALANVVKHARASRAEVTVERIGGILLVVVSDDGVGGADESGGTGLAGLVKRVASVDGTFSISSPVGGPTVVTVELPCAP